MSADARRVKATDILIVEDSRTQAEQLAYILENRGYLVAIATNGEEALAAARKSQPRLVISDVLMPVMDGYAMCRAFKDDDGLKTIPVIMLSTLSDPQDVIFGMDAGVDYYLTKPYQAETLLSKVEAVLAAPAAREIDDALEDFPVTLAGEKRFVKSTRQRIMNLLLSTYENAVRHNKALISMQDELSTFSERLEKMVEERMADLRQEVATRRRAEEEVKTMTQHLWQAAKLATMGELAASIAHELNNPLATASLRIESLRAGLAENDPRRVSLEVVEKEIDRMARLVADLLQFSRRSQSQVSTVDVREEVEKSLDLIHYHLRKSSIEVRKILPPEARMILADRQQLRQVFLNLFSNAADAMPRGGILSISVSTKDSPAQVLIEVSDTGEGIPQDILPKLMTPFFTTKPEGKGTGLGLSICRRIIQEHKGTLNITSEVGKGTIISIALPATSGTATPMKDEKNG
ncbi:MAG TPA: ATP-binding protein [Spirochaetia bacterium]|nr:ATP-binding protein [Spirochaetia bacterium]